MGGGRLNGPIALAVLVAGISTFVPAGADRVMAAGCDTVNALIEAGFLDRAEESAGDIDDPCVEAALERIDSQRGSAAAALSVAERAYQQALASSGGIDGDESAALAPLYKQVLSLDADDEVALQRLTELRLASAPVSTTTTTVDYAAVADTLSQLGLQDEARSEVVKALEAGQPLAEQTSSAVSEPVGFWEELGSNLEENAVSWAAAIVALAAIGVLAFAGYLVTRLRNKRSKRLSLVIPDPSDTAGVSFAAAVRDRISRPTGGPTGGVDFAASVMAKPPDELQLQELDKRLGIIDWALKRARPASCVLTTLTRHDKIRGGGITVELRHGKRQLSTTLWSDLAPAVALTDEGLASYCLVGPTAAWILAHWRSFDRPGLDHDAYGTTSWESLAFTQKGLDLLKLGHRDHAYAAFERAAAFDPTNLAAQFNVIQANRFVEHDADSLLAAARRLERLASEFEEVAP